MSLNKESYSWHLYFIFLPVNYIACYLIGFHWIDSTDFKWIPVISSFSMFLILFLKTVFDFKESERNKFLKSKTNIVIFILPTIIAFFGIVIWLFQ